VNFMEFTTFDIWLSLDHVHTACIIRVFQNFRIAICALYNPHGKSPSERNPNWTIFSKFCQNNTLTVTFI